MKVFVIHGWTYNLDKWQPLLSELEQYGVEPVMLKVPGLTAESSKVWTIQGYIAWLDDQIKSESEPIVIGHSNGGRIALAYINKYPNRIRQLILIDSAGIADKRLYKKIKLKVLYVLSKVLKPLSKIKPLQKIVYRVIGARDYQEAPDNMKLTMRNMLDADKRLDLSAVNVPTTIIWGRDDKMTPLHDGQAMNQLIKGSKLHVINGARHAPMSTHPKQVAAIILKTLDLS